MFKSTLIAFFLSCLACCSLSQEPAFPIHEGDPVPGKNEAMAVFGEGCFWHSEIIFQSLYGVRDAVSGYAGGRDPSPTYESVSGGRTGHAECVQVFYDPEKVGFRMLVKAFFESHDPTTLNRQGNDVGTEYRSIIFYRNEEERRIIESQLAEAQMRFRAPIVTEIRPYSGFYPAEPYHQEYILNHPGNRYVQRVSIPEYEHFRENFKGRFKP